MTDFLYCATPSPPPFATSTVDSLYDTFEPLHVPTHRSTDSRTTTDDLAEARYLLQLMLLAECRSSHPLAKGITVFCKAQLALLESVSTLSKNSILPLEEDLLFDVVPGLGIHMHTTDTNSTNISSPSTSVLVGSGKLLQSMNVAISPAAERTASSYRAGGKVAVFMAVNGRLRAIVGKCVYSFSLDRYIVENIMCPAKGCILLGLTVNGSNSFFLIGYRRCVGCSAA